MEHLMPKIFGDPSGNQTGSATTESGQSYKIFEPTIEIDKSNPDYNKRVEHQDFLHKKYGLPSKRASMSESEIGNTINSETVNKERKLWERVFGDQARYEDRMHLSPKIQNVWKDALLKMRKNIDVRLRGDLKNKQDEYDYKKGLVDEDLKAFDSYLIRYSAASVKAEKDRAKAAENSKKKSDRIELNKKKDLDKLYVELSKIEQRKDPIPTKTDMDRLNIIAKRAGISVEDVVTKKAEERKLSNPLTWLGGDPEEREFKVSPLQKKVVRTGTHKGRKVNQYDDGSVEYAD